MQITIRNDAAAAADKKSHSRFSVVVVAVEDVDGFMCYVVLLFLCHLRDYVPLNKFLGQLGSVIESSEREKNTHTSLGAEK